MITSETLLLIALGFSCIFGLQGALNLAIYHLNPDRMNEKKSCNKILISKEALFFKIPIAYIAIIFYVFLIIQLIKMINEEKIYFYWINIQILFAVFVTIYYAFVMILKLRIICYGCLRIYFANLLMATIILVYYFF